MGRRYRNGWWLVQKYHEEGWTQAQIAEACGVSPRCIRDWMDRHGIETRDLVGENHPQHGTERDVETRRKISESMQGREITDAHRQRIAEGHEGDERLLDVHHIIPVRRFREADDTTLAEAHDPRNLVVLCRHCHPKADNGPLEFESGIDPPE